jgi:hypothetical protein
MVDRARKKKRPEQQPRPDCSVAQLTLGTPLSLLAAPQERPEKIQYAKASVGPGSNQCNSRAKIRMARVISTLFGTFQRCGNRRLVRPAGLGNSTAYRPIVEFNESRQVHRAASGGLSLAGEHDLRPELVRCNDALHYDCAPRRPGR